MATTGKRARKREVRGFLGRNRLRVFRGATTAHLGRGVGQERWWCVGPSEKAMIRQKANIEEPRCWYDHCQRSSREEGDDHAIPVARRRGVCRSRIKRSGAVVPDVRGAAHGV